MKRRSRNGMTREEYRKSLDSFLPPSIDEPPTGGMEIMLPISMRRLSTVARIRSLTASTEADVAKVKEADERKAAAEPKPGPEWIERPEAK